MESIEVKLFYEKFSKYAVFSKLSKYLVNMLNSFNCSVIIQYL